MKALKIGHASTFLLGFCTAQDVRVAAESKFDVEWELLLVFPVKFSQQASGFDLIAGFRFYIHCPWHFFHGELCAFRHVDSAKAQS